MSSSSDGSEPRDDLSRHESVTPDPDADEKVDSPTDLRKRTWGYVLKKSIREFMDDQCTDLAAGLTYYAVLAVFPAAIALLSILGVLGQTDAAIDAIDSTFRGLVSSDVLDTVTKVLEGIGNSGGTGLALILGLAGALWSASGYVGGFGRAMNRIYEIGEGRPIWKLRPLQVLITLILLLLMCVVVLLIATAGPIAEEIGKSIGLGSTAVLVWSIVKWPIVLALVVLIVAILYYATPNVKQPKFRWLSIGALIAIVVAVLAGAGFYLYAANFGSYNKTYGSLAGAVLFMLFLWLMNLALLFGAEVDAELERGRQLQAGIAAEEEIQLPARDTRNIEKNAEKDAKDVEDGRRIREAADADEAFGRTDRSNRN